MESALHDTIPLQIEPPIGSSFFQPSDIKVETITPDLMRDEDRIIYIRDQWRFKAGDDPDWADPAADDQEWDVVSTNLTQADLAFIDWDGIGWFRKKMKVDSSLTGKPMALLVDRHFGASEVYLNGEKIFELGSFSTNPEEVKNYNSNQPLAIVFPEKEEQLIAVRFINPNFAETGQLLGNNGFRFLLGDWETHQSAKFAFVSSWTGTNMFYIGVLLSFSLIHFLLFLFYPIERRNLFFSVFVAGLMVITYLFYKIELASNTFDTLYLMRFMMVSELLVLAFATRFTHSLDKSHSALFVNGLLIAGFMVALLVWFFPRQLMIVRDAMIFIYLIEILRSLFLMIYKKRSGVWVLGAGVLIFVVGLVMSILINHQFLSGSASVVNMASSGALIISMSIFLSRDFASTQKILESKLVEVQNLSEKALRQEKINKEREIEKRLLEAENKRKSAELEEARALQMSMLPKKMPNEHGFDIAVHMQTATEVGGDYYDYSIDKDGTLVLALGDATGHGMKAGIMVAAAKSYFHTLVHESDNLTILKRISAGLRNMNMRLMYMGLILVRCNNRDLDISIAGMPPVLHFCRESQSLKKIILKGLPLGSKTNYPYLSKKVKLNEGDVLLLMSDGILELFNEEREMLGIEKVADVIKNSNGYSANDIINQLKLLAESWTSGTTPHDDITLMVLKVPEK
jgi:serine phosphatase RsbU (regulator of sigma subunit)